MTNPQPRHGLPPSTTVLYQPVALLQEYTTSITGEQLPPQQEQQQHSCTEISIDDAMERLGLGRWQLQILSATGLSYAADGMQVILLSFLTPVLQREWELSTTQTATLSSTLFVGAFMGTLLWGPLADRIGRRPVFIMATLVITVASTTMSWWVSDYTGMLLTTWGIGCGVGGLTIPFDILAEFLPTHRRGQKLLEINYAWTVGVLYVVAGAYLFLNAQPPNWRSLVRWCSLPSFVSLLIGVYLIPESPRWLTSQGRLEEAMLILKRAERTSFSPENAIFPEGMTLKCQPQSSHATLADLFRPQWIGLTLRLWGAWFTFAFGYFGTILITTRIFSSDDPNNATHDTDTTQFDYSAIFITTLAEFIGTTIAIVTIDRMGRIRSQVVSFLTAGIFLLFFCLLAQWNAKRWVLLLAAFIARIFEMTATCILWAATAEILNTEIRGAGHSSSNAMARVGAIFCPLLVQNTTSLIHVGVTMFIFHSVTAFCVSRLPETNGRTMGFGYST